MSLTQEVADFALLPLVVKVGVFAWTSKSHGAREAILDSRAAARMLARDYRAPWKLRV